MLRFIDFLFYAISGLFLTYVAQLFIASDIPQFVAFAALITGILFYLAAIYQVVKD